MGRCQITRGRQALELRSNLSERRSLTDRIKQTSACSASYSARNLQWAVAHGTGFTQCYCHVFSIKTKDIVFKCISSQSYLRATTSCLTVAWRFSLVLLQNSPTSWSSIPGYLRSPKKSSLAPLSSQISLRCVCQYYIYIGKTQICLIMFFVCVYWAGCGCWSKEDQSRDSAWSW